MTSPTEPLETECRTISRYLIDAEPASDIIRRYAEACAVLWPTAEISRELRWFRKHPASLRWLDAGAAIVARDSLIRQRVLLMAALLEATTAHAEYFLEPPPKVGKAIFLTIWGGKLAVLKALIGVPLLWWARSAG